RDKIRGTYRLLGLFLVILLALMGGILYLGLLEKPVLGIPQVINSLWLLSLVALSVVLPAFVNFGVGTYLAETMLLRANVFAFRAAKEDYNEKKAKKQMMEKAKQLKAQREALRAQNAQPAPEAGKPAAPAK